MAAMILRIVTCLCAVVAIVSCASSRGYTSIQYSTHNLHNCVESGHQRFIELKEMMGMWSVIEVIEHSERYNERRNYLRNAGSCPTVHFSTDEDREIHMVWNDEIGYVNYIFRLTNINNPGFWISLGYQTGTMVNDRYEHFSGTAQVMKAVQSHMVLTFCSPHEKHFSIILSRSKHISFEEVRGVHKQLNRVNLPLVVVKSYCESAGVSLNPSAVAATVLAFIVCFKNQLA